MARPPMHTLLARQMRGRLTARLRSRGYRSADMEMTAQVGQLRQHREIVILELVEQRAHPRRYLMVDADVLGQGIDVLTVTLQREVQMRPGGEPAAADTPDNLAP